MYYEGAFRFGEIFVSISSIFGVEILMDYSVNNHQLFLESSASLGLKF